MLFTWYAWYLIFSGISNVIGYCSNDEDLQQHRCTCSLAHGYIQCPSLPKRCRTCYLYKSILFDEHVNVLSAESFRDYDVFDYDSNNSFTFQFARITSMASRAFSKIALDEDRSLSIQITEYTSPTLPTRLFDQIEMESKSKIDFELYSVTSPLLSIEPYAFQGIGYAPGSVFRFSIFHIKHTIQFQRNAGTLFLPSNSTMDFYFSNFVHASLTDHSFNHVNQGRSSNLQIHFDHFHHASIGNASFMEFHQLDHSHFHLIFSNFQNLHIESKLFSAVTQLQSSMIFSLNNMSTDLCLPAETFHSIKQDSHSTLQFEVDYGKTVYLSPQTFSNISQMAQSKLSIIVRNSLDVYFSDRSMTNIHQQEKSLLDIWIKYGRNLIFEKNAIENIDIQRSSIMRIGYLHSNGVLDMDVNAFANINEGQGGQLLFQITNSSNFYLRFNQSMTLNSLEIIDRILTDDDFCRISAIPAHIPVKLCPDNVCSCSVLYLYRQLHRTLRPSLLRSLTPRCYSNLSPDQIEHEETKCSFNKQLANCHHKHEHLLTPNKKCLKHSYLNPINRSKSSTFAPLILILLCVSLGLLFIYLIATRKRRILIYNLFYKYSKRRVDSYQPLTHNDEMNVESRTSSNKTMQIVMKYNSITKQTHRELHTDQSDFISNSDQLQVNSNPLSDIDESNIL